MYSSRRFYAGLLLLSYFWMIIVLAACSPFPPQPTSSTRQSVRKSVPTPMLGASHCKPPSPITPLTTGGGLGLPEVRGTTSGKTELWALLFGDMVAKQELKIVWRMTGNGDMQMVARGPRGKSVKAKWMTFHSGSTWNRPGAEWGTGFILPEPGCWDFSVSRGDASGDVWFLVK